MLRVVTEDDDVDAKLEDLHDRVERLAAAEFAAEVTRPDGPDPEREKSLQGLMDELADWRREDADADRG